MAKFAKGTSGNPRGRPPGTTSRAKFRALIDPEMPGIVAGVVTAAKGGDMAAARILIDRVIPALKPTADALRLTADGTLAERGEAIVRAMAAGQCSPDQAKAGMDVLAAQAKLIEQAEIVERLDRIEAWLSKHNAAA